MKRALLLLAALPSLAGVALIEHYALTRQRLQARVDVAAAHAAEALVQGRDLEEEVRTTLAETPVLRAGDRIEVETPPGTGRFRRWRNAVRVRVGQTWSPPLVPSGLADRFPLDVAATAVAVAPGPGHPEPVFLRVE